jgi:hypothetical protein
MPAIEWPVVICCVSFGVYLIHFVCRDCNCCVSSTVLFSNILVMMSADFVSVHGFDNGVFFGTFMLIIDRLLSFQSEVLSLQLQSLSIVIYELFFANIS